MVALGRLGGWIASGLEVTFQTFHFSEERTTPEDREVLLEGSTASFDEVTNPGTLKRPLPSRDSRASCIAFGPPVADRI